MESRDQRERRGLMEKEMGYSNALIVKWLE